MSARRRVIIVGAGVAGLTLAARLADAGESVTVLEKESEVGGLARSFTYDGFTFDIGPHRFSSDLPRVMAFVSEVLGDDALIVDRKSAVRVFGRYLEWPLSLRAATSLPLRVILSVAADLLRPVRNDGKTFEDYIVGCYGETLYRIFFKPYTEKFLGIPCSSVATEWASASIDRAVIDRRRPMNDLLSIARSLRSSTLPFPLLYPACGGISVFGERLSDRIASGGGSVIVEAAVDEIRLEGGRVTTVVAGSREYKADLLIWTGSLGYLRKLLGRPAVGLEYLSMLLYNYQLDHPPLLPYQWCYFGAAEVPFNRASVPSAFNPRLAPHGKSGLCIEVTCREGDALWRNSEEREALIRKSLGAEGLIDVGRVLGVAVERVADVYPVYSVGYQEKIGKMRHDLAAVPNLKLLGRTGTFWYNNMDDSIEAALNLADEIRQG